MLTFIIVIIGLAAPGSPPARRTVSADPVAAAAVVSAGLQPTQAIAAREKAVNGLATDCAVANCIALTFDDGPARETTPRVLDVLERDHVPATFFVLGKQVQGNEHLLRRIFINGHEVGNHSWSHTSFLKLDAKQMHDQIGRTQAAVMAAGLPRPLLFRPPYGESNDAVRAHVAMAFMYWNEDPKDWAAKSPQEITDAVVRDAKRGGVIVMHDTEHKTAEALPAIIQELRKRNYTFVTASHLMGLQPGQRGSYYGQH